MSRSHETWRQVTLGALFGVYLHVSRRNNENEALGNVHNLFVILEPNTILLSAECKKFSQVLRLET
jgi:hypothetical protein